MKTTDDTDCTDGIRRARGPGWLMGLVLGVVLMVGLGATVWTGYRSTITATFNTGAVHGLYWGRNSNNVVDASMTLAANSRYLYSGSRWGSNILQSLIKVDH
jgi:hypothetical protein